MSTNQRLSDLIDPDELHEIWLTWPEILALAAALLTLQRLGINNEMSSRAFDKLSTIEQKLRQREIGD